MKKLALLVIATSLGCGNKDKNQNPATTLPVTPVQEIAQNKQQSKMTCYRAEPRSWETAEDIKHPTTSFAPFERIYCSLHTEQLGPLTVSIKFLPEESVGPFSTAELSVMKEVTHNVTVANGRFSFPGHFENSAEGTYLISVKNEAATVIATKKIGVNLQVGIEGE